ncbi:MAG: sigma-70 family RNA polymerase sigma factor [Acidobacteriia bacterium]|nr:sigma-70 family RNA polymerase sigma factor [Terriglobia bacterium]
MGSDGVVFDAGPLNLVDRVTLERQFDRLLAANGPALTRLAASYTNTAGDRDDLLQEIALAIWQALPRFRGESSERTFLFRIAHNRAISYLARVRSQPPSVEEWEVHDPSPNPELGLAREQAAARLRAAVHRLPVAWRQVVTLTLEGLGYGEIAEVLGISESNVGARLSRARQMLREALENKK